MREIDPDLDMRDLAEETAATISGFVAAGNYGAALWSRMNHTATLAVMGLLADGYDVGDLSEIEPGVGWAAPVLATLERSQRLGTLPERGQLIFECLDLIDGLASAIRSDPVGNGLKIAFMSNELGLVSSKFFDNASAVMKGLKSGDARRTWQDRGLNLARELRAADSRKETSVIGTIIQREIEGAPARLNTIEKQLRLWEDRGELTRKARE
jgi:hypothetical protein